MSQRLPQNVMRFVSPTDLSLVEIAKSLFVASPPISEVTFTLGPSYNLTASSIDELDKLFSHNLSTERRIKLARYKSNFAYELEFVRGTYPGNNTNKYIPSAQFVEFCFVGPENSRVENRDLIQNYLDAIHAHLSEQAQSSLFSPEDIGATLASHVEMLASRAVEATQRIDQRDIESREREKKRLEELEEEYRNRHEELEHQYKDRHSSLEEAKKVLNAEREEYDALEARFNRRIDREAITKKLRERLSKSAAPAGSLSKRIIVSGIAITGIIAGGFISIGTLQGMSNGDVANLGLASPAFWIFASKVIASSALASGLLLYLLSFWRRLAIEDADFSRRLELFSLDIDRASWTIETLLEFNKEDSANVPEVWLDGVTHNLFERHSPDHTSEPEALEALAALLDAGVKLNAGTNGIHFEVDRRTGRKISRDAK